MLAGLGNDGAGGSVLALNERAGVRVSSLWVRERVCVCVHLRVRNGCAALQKVN